MNISKVKTGEVILYGKGYSNLRTLDGRSIKATYYGGYNLTNIIGSGVQTVILQDWNGLPKENGGGNNYTVINYDVSKGEWKSELLTERPLAVFPDKITSVEIQKAKAQANMEIKKAQRAIEILKEVSPEILRSLNITIGA